MTLAKAFSTLAGGPEARLRRHGRGGHHVHQQPPRPGATTCSSRSVPSASTPARPGTTRRPRQRPQDHQGRQQDAQGRERQPTADETQAATLKKVDAKASKQTLTPAGGQTQEHHHRRRLHLPDPREARPRLRPADGRRRRPGRVRLRPAQPRLHLAPGLRPGLAPPPVFITLSGSASVTVHIVAGFDTYGLRKAFEAGLTGSTAVGILDGLFFKTTEDDGQPDPGHLAQRRDRRRRGGQRRHHHGRHRGRGVPHRHLPPGTTRTTTASSGSASSARWP